MGALWLATVPADLGPGRALSGACATWARFKKKKHGIVFFSHQLGSFLGGLAGRALYDIYGSYTAVWWVGVAVGAFSALVHLPIREDRTPAAPLPA